MEKEEKDTIQKLQDQIKEVIREVHKMKKSNIR